MILSISRRTDIPAFYGDWLFERLNEGYAYVPNPFFSNGKIARVKLAPLKITGIARDSIGNCRAETEGTVEGIVFWSKNPKPIMNKLSMLKDYVYYFLYTLNPYPEAVEAGLPTISKRIDTFKELSEQCPCIWRYDPILLAKEISVDWHIEQFGKLAKQLSGFTKCCKISFVTESYPGCSKNVKSPNSMEKNELLRALSLVAKENGIHLEACAEEGDFSVYGIYPSRCIDGGVFEELLNKKYKGSGIEVKRKNKKEDGQRKNCGCMPCVDIGRYDTCKHNCVYCYARKGNPKSMTAIPSGEIYERKVQTEFVYYSKT